MTQPTDAPWPVELRVKRDDRRLEVAFDSGERFSIAAELLRVESPSAEIKGHGGGPPNTPGGKRDVAIIGAEPVGSYAVRLIFDDGHDTGLFTWPLLYRLGREQDAAYKAYLDALAARGRSRDP